MRVLALLGAAALGSVLFLAGYAAALLDGRKSPVPTVLTLERRQAIGRAQRFARNDEYDLYNIATLPDAQEAGA